MKQYTFFEDEKEEVKEVYTKKVGAPIYEPKNKKPYVLELYDDSKFKRLRRKIESSDLPDDVKKFLFIAATRHIVFNYDRIADFYAHSDPEVQDLMEQSALVVIDFKKAVEHGYLNLSQKVVQEYIKQKKDNDEQ